MRYFSGAIGCNRPEDRGEENCDNNARAARDREQLCLLRVAVMVTVRGNVQWPLVVGGLALPAQRSISARRLALIRVNEEAIGFRSKDRPDGKRRRGPAPLTRPAQRQSIRRKARKVLSPRRLQALTFLISFCQLWSMASELSDAPRSVDRRRRTATRRSRENVSGIRRPDLLFP